MAAQQIRVSDLTGRQKAAILMISVGPEAAAATFKNMANDEIEAIVTEMLKWDDVPSDLAQAVIEEFYEQARSRQYISRGGEPFAQKALAQSFGEQRAVEILDKVQGRQRAKGFGMLEQVDKGQLIDFLLHEHPQTVALILAHLSREQAASILSHFPPDLQEDIAYRMAHMENIPPGLLKEVEEILESHMASAFSHHLTVVGGPTATADLLNLTDSATTQGILERLEKRDPTLAEQVKKQMFTFDDIRFVEPRGLQLLLRGIEAKDLAIALKLASPATEEKVMSCIPSAKRLQVQEEREYAPPMRMRDIEEVQEKIIALVRAAVEKGDVVVTGKGGGAGEQVV